MDEPKFRLGVTYMSKPEENKLSSFKYNTHLITADQLIAYIEPRLRNDTCDIIQMDITVINNEQETTT